MPRRRPPATLPVRTRDSLNRPGLAVCCGLLLVGLVWSAFTFPNFTGMFDDDAVYQVTASAIAGGHGYVRIDRPGTPYQTKYPPVYPLMLAPFSNLAGGYPGNIGWLRLPAVLAAVLSVWFGLLYVARRIGLPRGGLVVLVIMCATLPELRLLVLVTMSEWPFAAVAFAALILAERAADADAHRTARTALAAGALAGVAYLTRTIGITVGVAIVGWLLWQRRPKAALLAALPWLMCVAGWTSWTRWAAARDAGLHASPLLQYDLDYTAWIPSGVGDLWLVAKANLGQFALVNSQFFLRLSRQTVTGFFHSDNQQVWLWHGMAWGLVALIVVGFVYSARKRLSAGHVFLALYFAVVLLWPFQPNRFIIPVFPLLAAFALCGCGWVIERLRLKETRRRTAELGVAIALGVMTLVLNTAGWNEMVSTRNGDVLVGGAPLKLAARRKTADWIAHETPPDAVVACISSSAMWLATGRKTVSLVPNVNPVAYDYSRGRTFRHFYFGPVMPDQIQAAQVASAHLIDFYQMLGVMYVVRKSGDIPLHAAAFDAQRAEHPDRFQVAWDDAGLGVTVWRGPQGTTRWDKIQAGTMHPSGKR